MAIYHTQAPASHDQQCNEEQRRHSWPISSHQWMNPVAFIWRSPTTMFHNWLHALQCCNTWQSKGAISLLQWYHLGWCNTSSLMDSILGLGVPCVCIQKRTEGGMLAACRGRPFCCRWWILLGRCSISGKCEQRAFESSVANMSWWSHYLQFQFHWSHKHQTYHVWFYHHETSQYHSDIWNQWNMTWKCYWLR